MQNPKYHSEEEAPHWWRCREREICRAFCRPHWIRPVLLCLSAAPLSAEQCGLFTYSVSVGEVPISDYPEDATGDVAITAEIDGNPVTEIGSDPFEDCRRIISVSIPTAPLPSATTGHSCNPSCRETQLPCP